MARLLALSLVMLACGCQHITVQKKVNQLVSTVPALYYEQVLNNLARTAVAPNAIPYFGTPSQGTNLNQRQIQASYTPGWDLLSSGGFFGTYLFDKQSALLQGQVQNQQSIQLNPITDPDKLLYMQYAYRTALGDQTLGQPERDALANFFQLHKSSAANYYKAITGKSLPPAPDETSSTGATDTTPEQLPDAQAEDVDIGASMAEWFILTKCRKDIPKHACYVGRYCDMWVWVPEENVRELSLFTLAILDIATATASSPKPTEIALQAMQVTPIMEGEKVKSWNIEALKKPDHKAVPKKSINALGPALLPRMMQGPIAGPPVAQ